MLIDRGNSNRLPRIIHCHRMGGQYSHVVCATRDLKWRSSGSISPSWIRIFLSGHANAPWGFEQTCAVSQSNYIAPSYARSWETWTGNSDSLLPKLISTARINKNKMVLKLYLTHVLKLFLASRVSGYLLIISTRSSDLPSGCSGLPFSSRPRPKANSAKG